MLPLLLLPALLSACSASAPDPTVTVAIPARPAVQHYDVWIHDAAHRVVAHREMASGQRVTFPAPAGWVTVRVSGLCVVPHELDGGSVKVTVAPDRCTVT
jgi:hypothetical protein